MRLFNSGVALLLAATWHGRVVTALPRPQDSTTTTTSVDPSAAVPTGSPGGAYTPCHNIDGPFAPFCNPSDGKELYVGEVYYITWDTASPLFSPNTTLKLVANYHNATSTSGSIAFTSDPTSASWGYIAWPIQASYLASGTSSSNVTLYLTTQSGHQATGPTVQLLYPPGPSPPPQTQAPKGRDLYIALPAVAGFILVCVVGGFFWNRKQRTIGLGNVMGRKRGYGERKSRRQRLGLGGGRGKQAVALRVRELDGPGAYRDDVQAGSGRGKPEALDLDLGFDTPRKFAGHQRTDSEGLGSLVGTPTEERPRGNGNGNGNVFREEIRRQDVSRFST